MSAINGRQSGVASAAPHHVPVLALSAMSVTNLHAGIELRSFAPGSDLKLLDACQRRFDAVARSWAGLSCVQGLRPEDYFARQAMVVAARRRSDILGVAHCYRTQTGMNVGGLAVDPGATDDRLGSAILALAVTHGRAVFGEAASIEGAVRVGPGRIEEWSYRSFERLGFRPQAEPVVSYLTGTFRDRHLFESAEEDDEGAVYVRYRSMIAGPACYERARDALAHWSNAVLPLAPRRLGR